jgi:hypothetical protein
MPAILGLLPAIIKYPRAVELGGSWPIAGIIAYLGSYVRICMLGELSLRHPGQIPLKRPDFP